MATALVDQKYSSSSPLVRMFSSTSALHGAVLGRFAFGPLVRPKLAARRCIWTSCHAVQLAKVPVGVLSCSKTRASFMLGLLFVQSNLRSSDNARRLVLIVAALEKLIPMPWISSNSCPGHMGSQCKFHSSDPRTKQQNDGEGRRNQVEPLTQSPPQL